MSRNKYKIFSDIFPLYISKWGVVEQLVNLGPTKRCYISDFKLQKTNLTEGFHAWHCENSGEEEFSHRHFAYTLYLNDVKEGGQTVFPMAGTAITPSVGSVAIWPAGLPFYHCGLKSKTTKYILTSWFEFM